MEFEQYRRITRSVSKTNNPNPNYGEAFGSKNDFETKKQNSNTTKSDYVVKRMRATRKAFKQPQQTEEESFANSKVVKKQKVKKQKKTVQPPNVAVEKQRKGAQVAKKTAHKSNKSKNNNKKFADKEEISEVRELCAKKIQRKSKKRQSDQVIQVTNKASRVTVAKLELKIPRIVIPMLLKRIARSNGPSPWNGTISYTNKIYFGATISAAGGLENAIPNALEAGVTCFALFLKSQRQWASKPLEETTAIAFKEGCRRHNFASHLILPHGSYLMNCGSSDPDIIDKSRATLLEEVQRCERLGILYYNIHPGSTCGKISREECIQNIADSINWVHHETPRSQVVIVLENMCRQGNTIGGDLSELAGIISLVADQSRVGVCLDTCHAFAAGYDLASEEGFESFLEEFERNIGFCYLVAVHLNDSEGPLDCHRDRHAAIGKGYIGIEGFRRIVNCVRFRDIPVVLETPIVTEETYAESCVTEIKLLKSLANGDTVCA